MIKKKENIALIGCGRIGFLLEDDPLRYKPCTHYGGAKAAGLRINYACDINGDRLRRFAELAGLPDGKLYADYRRLIYDIKPEMVIIATWTESHADIGILASRNGARVIVCEKPVAANLADAARLVKECRKNGTALIINHERRYDPRYRKVKSMIERGNIGEVKTVHASILTGGYRGQSRPEEGGGPLLHDGTHMIDIIRFFFGEIINVRGEIQREKRKSGFEDRAVAWLKTAGGVDAFLEAGGGRKYFVFELSISGTEGKIVIGNGYEQMYVKSRSKFYSGFNDLLQRPFPQAKGPNYFKAEYIEAKNIINNKSVLITSTGADGCKALEAVHAVYLSSYLKKEVELPVSPGMIDLKNIFGLR